MKILLPLLTGVLLLTTCLCGIGEYKALAQEPQLIAPPLPLTPSSPPHPVNYGPPANMQPAPSPEVALGGQGVQTIANLEAIAMANNPTITQASQRVAALQGKHLQVGLRPNPVIGYEGEEMGDEGAAGQQGMFVSQKFITANKLQLNRNIVSHEIQEARRVLDMQRLRVTNAVRGRAYEVVIAQREITLNKQLVAIGEEGVKAANQLLQAKEVSRVDVLQARVEASSAKLALNNSLNEYKAAWQRLAIVLGTPELEPVPLADELGENIPQLSWENAKGRLLAESPELQRALSGVERAKCALARAKAGQTPDFDVETAVRYNSATESTTATVGFAVPLQIFDYNQGNVHKAYAELNVARQEVGRVELVLQDRLATEFKRYANARQQAEQYKAEILADAKSSLDLVSVGYQHGEFGYLELLTAQRTYFRVNLAYLDSVRELWVSSVQIEGLLLSGGLETPGE